ELAAQVYQSFLLYGKNIPLRCAVVYGGVNIAPQQQILKAGVEILVATPGRLIDLVEQKNVRLSQVQVLVLDEADRMLDMGFIPDIKRILGLLPPNRQSLLFSATFNDEVTKLSNSFLQQPKRIEASNRNATAELIEQTAWLIDTEHKQSFLVSLINKLNLQQVLIFTRTRQGTNQLATRLNRARLNTQAIHGDKTQQARMEALDQFKNGQSRILVATDIAARGLDIQELPCVINFELPNSAEDYVHRIGRTGRAGASGLAISLVCPEELKLLEDIEKLIKRKIERQDPEKFLVPETIPASKKDVQPPVEQKKAHSPSNRFIPSTVFQGETEIAWLLQSSRLNLKTKTLQSAPSTLPPRTTTKQPETAALFRKPAHSKHVSTQKPEKNTDKIDS
ncbi:MAG: DEAD/DEAH box helicase, partial [Pseudomonadota bacterium]|nr:DEAD/DEAH box helicase [Pseudomonadota bacterium]